MKNFIRNIKNRLRKYSRRISDFNAYIVNKYKLDQLSIFLNRVSIVATIFYSAIIYFIMEMFSRHSFIKTIFFIADSPLVFLYNTFMVFLPFLIVYFFRRRIFVRTLITVFWLLIGTINGVVLLKRVTPFNAQDLKVVSDAVSLINSYFKPLQLIAIIIAIIVVILLLAALFILAPKYKGKMHYIRSVITIILFTGLFLLSTVSAINHRVLSTYFGNLAYSYEDYGLCYCFATSIFNTGISKPNDYNEEKMHEIAEKSDLAKSTNNSDNPNLIFVQLESFFDPLEVNYVKLNKDPIPNFRNLCSKYSTGYFTAPSIGAGTSNTEFEVLTGMSMRYFGPGEYPHKTILKTTQCESLASDMRKLGYSAHAIHNNGGNFYSRADVFKNLGFNSYTSKEFMNVLSTTDTGWAKDDILLKSIDDSLNSTDNTDFVFTITVESHGDYPGEKILENPEIQVTSLEDGSKKNSWEYYCNLLYDVDKFVKNLIDMIEKRNEPSVIVFYGDHIPTMNLKASDIDNRYLYNTEYVIWDNIGLTKTDKNYNAYQLSSAVLDKLDIHNGTLFNYHQNRQGTKNYQQDLELLQYDILYGKQYVYDNNPTIIPSDMIMGIRDTSITSVYLTATNQLIVRGTNFTQNSRVFINGKKYKTTFLSDEKLSVDLKDYELSDLDELVVSQMGSKNRVFKSSNTSYYNQGLNDIYRGNIDDLIKDANNAN